MKIAKKKQPEKSAQKFKEKNKIGVHCCVIIIIIAIAETTFLSNKLINRVKNLLMKDLVIQIAFTRRDIY